MKYRTIKFLMRRMAGVACLSLFAIVATSQCVIQGSNSFCAGSEVELEVENPQAGVVYEWDFNDDGNIDASGRFGQYTFPGATTGRSYTVTLYRDGQVCATKNITVNQGPDASLGINPNEGTFENGEFRVCTNQKVLTVGFFNSSTTLSINEKYEIAWGDGTFDEYDNSTFTPSRLIQHTYTEQGYKEITLRVTSTNGCISERKFLFYYGGNPSVGLVNPGNSTGLCVGESLTFPITDITDNPPETRYQIYINDELISEYDQTNIPPSFTYTFDETSCGKTTPLSSFKHAFEVRILAITPCGTSSAIIAPIEVSAPPELNLTIDEPVQQCIGEVYRLRNSSSTQEVVSNGTATQCVTSLPASWDIQGPGNFNVLNGNVFSSEELEVSFDVPGTYGITVTVTSAVCGSFTFTETIEVATETNIEPGDVSLTEDGSNVCAPSIIDVRNQIGNADNFDWEVTPSDGWSYVGGTDADSDEPSIQFDEGGEYIVRLQASNNCDTENWVDTILVEGAPSLELAGIADFCQQAVLDFDGSSVLFAENGYAIDSYAWSFPGADQGNSADPFPTGITYSSPGTYTVTASATNQCGTTSADQTFAIQGVLDATVPDTIQLCQNAAPLDLTAMPADGQWSGPGTQSGGRLDPSALGVGDNFIYYEVGIGQCADMDTTLVQVFPVPNPDAGPDRTVCITEDSLTLTANLGGGNWEALNGGQFGGDQFYPNASGPGTFDMRYVFTDALGCRAFDTLEVEVVEEVAILVNDTSYCEVPGQYDLPATNLPGGTWAGAGIAANRFDPQLAGGAGIYQLTYSVNNGVICPASEVIDVEVLPIPAIDAGRDDSICVSEPEFELQGLPLGGFWDGPDLDSSTTGIIIPGRVGSGRFNYVYTVGEGSCRVRDTLLLTLLDNPNVFAGPDRQICGNDPSFSLVGNTPAGGRWTGPGIQNEFTGEFDPALLPIGDHELIYSYSFPGDDCFAQDTVVITKRPIPSPRFDIPATYCQEDTLTIIDQSIGAYRWDWSFGNGSRSNSRNPALAFDSAGVYQVDLVVESDFGCVDSFSAQLEIIPPPSAQFALDQTGVCAPVTVDFFNQSSGINVSYLWEFGNGDTSMVANPMDVSFASTPRDTIFPVTLRAINECGEGVYVDSVQVLTTPDVNFGFSVDTSCSPAEVRLSNQTSGGIVDVSWNLGNGNSSQSFNPPMQTYLASDQPVTYEITLSARNACGLDSLTRPLYVKPANVDAFISVPQREGCGPFTVTFSNFTTVGANLTWDFGDGTTSKEASPTHTFTDLGTYRVVQYAENGCGFDSTSLELEVLPSPEVQFEMSTPPCVDSPLRFENRSSGADAFVWRFDTLATSSRVNTEFSFPREGEYFVALEGRSAANGCTTIDTQLIRILPLPDISMSLDTFAGCSPLPVNFNANSSEAVVTRWDFGDGNASGQLNPMYTFSDAGEFQVRVSATDSNGCTALSTPTRVTVYPQPELAFSPQIENICELPTRVRMENQSEKADQFQWDFGNNTVSSLDDPRAWYEESGEYEVYLWGENQFGCVDSMMRPVSIPKVPMADFEFDPPRGCSPLDVQFTDLSTNGDRFLWEFGDGTFSPEQNPMHTYLEEGIYDVRLIVSAGMECVDTLEFPGAIQVFPTPFANFEVLPLVQDVFDGTVLLRNLSEDANEYYWDFGDGNLSREESPTHKFRDDETRQIYLQVFGEEGCSDDSLLVFQPPAIKGLHIPTGFSPQSGLGDVRLFKPTGIGIKEYSLQIFSSYGELMWETNLLEDGRPVESWDGRVNGQLQPQDVYVWKCRAVFEDGTVWPGQKDSSGKVKNIGSLVLLR